MKVATFWDWKDETINNFIQGKYVIDIKIAMSSSEAGEHAIMVIMYQ